MSINGSMLRLARQRRQLSQIDAAPRLGIEQSLLSRIENGLVEAREEILVRAIEAYGFPRSFFELTEPIYGAPVSVHPMWRRKADVAVREMDAVVAELNIRLIQIRRLLQAAEYVHGTDLPRLDIDDYDNDPARIAGLIRAHWKLPKGPIKNLTMLVERAGVLVVHSPMSEASISGVTFSTPGMPPLITLNSDQPADRLRYTLAHELGHLVMHRFPSPNMEKEANEFASALLMPSQDIAPYFAGRKVDLQLLASLKPEWRVSMASLLMKARSLKIVTTHQEQYLWKQMNFRRIRLREPPELDFEVEKPTVVESLVGIHKDGLRYSDSELAAFLHSFEPDFRNDYGITSKTQRPRFSVMK